MLQNLGWLWLSQSRAMQAALKAAKRAVASCHVREPTLNIVVVLNAPASSASSGILRHPCVQRLGFLPAGALPPKLDPLLYGHTTNVHHQGLLFMLCSLPTLQHSLRFGMSNMHQPYSRLA